MAEKQNKYSSGIGGSLVLIIFIVLTITVFSVLTLVSAENELRTVERAIKASEDYYAAEKQAALKCGELENAVSGLTGQEEISAALLSAGAAVSADDEGITASFTVEIDNVRRLVTVMRPESGTLVIISQKITVPDDIIIDDGHDVWDGTFPF
ncbi:MAG: hypothetical protein J1F60_03675 [Oscillospiraceae bacterium]|nr:hypothetical protein [Oscillospiraceae bacterium]